MSSEVMDIDEASEFAKVSKGLIRKAIRTGHLQGAVIPGPVGVRVVKESLLDWINNGCKTGEDTND